MKFSSRVFFVLILFPSLNLQAGIVLKYEFDGIVFSEITRSDVISPLPGTQHNHDHSKKQSLDDTVSSSVGHSSHNGETSSSAMAGINTHVIQESSYRTKLVLTVKTKVVGGHEINKAGPIEVSSHDFRAVAQATIEAWFWVEGLNGSQPAYLLIKYDEGKESSCGSNVAGCQVMRKFSKPYSGKNKSAWALDGYPEDFLLMTASGEKNMYHSGYIMSHVGGGDGIYREMAAAITIDLLSYDTCDSKYDQWGRSSKFLHFREGFCALVRMNLANSGNAEADAREWIERDIKIYPRLELLDEMKRDFNKPRLASIADTRLREYWRVARTRIESDVNMSKQMKALIQIIKSSGPHGMIGVLHQAKQNLNDQKGKKKLILDVLENLEEMVGAVPSGQVAIETLQTIDQIRVAIDQEELIDEDVIDDLMLEIAIFVQELENIVDGVLFEGKFYEQMAT